jgi:hypothetical protein
MTLTPLVFQLSSWPVMAFLLSFFSVPDLGLGSS